MSGLVDWTIAVAIVLGWNGYLIYKMIKENKKNGTDINTSSKEE